ncbi:cell division control protein 2, putative [Cryptosporidium muris RN66]|uniref:Cyclin-dependent kinase 2 homolog n=1 Tax=Cryptosporidium muris (strain RN66) TaxID=441375 RepID=B6ABR1_CRYMR|nr:cell division control protein 2, putative [Cryptosporidium muris RN66]EEA05264.1 cell division control protein 2, putative [Cryptosporidium muris RN66]|eukprot:XP_002139613.1 cell division control protein 2 [Cryptosporidium muris RN66]
MLHKLLRGSNGIIYADDETNNEVLRDYERLEIVGEGTYGVVYRCRCKHTGKTFAIKYFRNNTEEITTTTLREISILRELNHPNIVNLLDIFIAKNSIHIIFEYISYDLKRFIRMFPQKILPYSLAKYIIYEILKGVCYLHSGRIVHRDLKPQNILVTDNKYYPKVKIADFGLARLYSFPLKTLTREVVTLWYRAPELLLGMKHYTNAVDIWSIGCIFLELIIGRPIFWGDSEIATLYKIFQLLGTPNKDVWNEVNTLPDFSNEWPHWKINDYWIDNLLIKSGKNEDLFKDNHAKCLIKRMLLYDPNKRISALEALENPWFDEFKI